MSKFKTLSNVISKRAKKTNQRMGKKTFANQISDKSLLSRMYKELLQLNHKKTAQFKTGKRFEQISF